VTAGEWLLVSIGVVVALYALLLVYLFAAGRGQTARAVARFVPDCIVLFRRLLGDPRVPRRKKILLGGVLAISTTPSSSPLGSVTCSAARQG
jgi:hypothetical protein